MTFVLVAMLFGAPCGTHHYVCDLVELNTVYSEDNGKEILTQVIWWTWDYKTNDYVVRDWRLIRDCKEPFKRDGQYVTRWNDKGTWREVRSKLYKRTHLLFDPETENRKLVPECERNRIR